jgi:hypothetical protein
MAIPKTIKQAQKLGMRVEREVRYFAVDRQGFRFLLPYECHYECPVWRKKPAKKKG